MCLSYIVFFLTAPDHRRKKIVQLWIDGSKVGNNTCTTCHMMYSVPESLTLMYGNSQRSLNTASSAITLLLMIPNIDTYYLP